MDEIDFLVTSAQAYVNASVSVFNMFLTVLFGSLAFSASMSLRDIGRSPMKIGCLPLSWSSCVIGSALLAFYIISFASFYDATKSAEILLEKLSDLVSKRESIKSTAVLFKPQDNLLGSLPVLGYMIGSVCGLVAFMWLANVERKK